MIEWLWILVGALLAGPLWLWLARVRLRRTLQRARRIVARRREPPPSELSALTGGLAHEIRNPLSTIKLNLQLLIEDLAPAADERQQTHLHRLEAVADEVARLQDVLEDFLRFIGRPDLHLAPVDLGGLVRDLADFFAPQAQAAQVRVRVETPDRPVVVRADGDLLKQAMLNLMINAQQAMPDGGEMAIRVRRSRRRAYVDVVDTGCGMTPEVAARVFEAYFTTKPGGTGLGLAIVQRIIQEHGGQITVDSQPGAGTTFTLRLPAAGPDGAAAQPVTVRRSPPVDQLR